MKKSVFEISRRTLLLGGAAALAMPMINRKAWAKESLVVADPGGPFTQGYRAAFYDDFTAETGIEIQGVARDAEPTAQFKSIVETGSYIWDVCTATLSARLILERDDLLEPLNIPAEAVIDVMPEAVHSNMLGTDVYSTVLAYNKETCPKAPTRWADFWNLEEFPGRRSLRKNPLDTIEIALMADGVEPKDLYPLDLDRAFRKLDEIKDHIDVWWTGGAQSTQLLESGEVDMIAGWNARFQAAIDNGAPAEIVWNQGLYSIEGWVVPKGCPKADLAREFVAFCAQARQQAKFTPYLAYGPTNLKAYDFIPPERATILPTAPQNLSKMSLASDPYWLEHRNAVTERFNGWLLQ
ncbi:ABC transporter substrate-binding protein [Falsochrobactrum ovis]|uniref:Putative spermidine/putrescine transport system substrate-binding protein n=1 Tax=Falsochrobactrum ovis TaxID=1293442 RepID=A0A364JS99_9HYPH|nr:ABC transporter substrate-binding protein [Falsochrobactrum ovis]RAK25763.1 putative spermidine/putrescine transport system substrate-binding protein [Falsochrobactrum ovis]